MRVGPQPAGLLAFDGAVKQFLAGAGACCRVLEQRLINLEQMRRLRAMARLDESVVGLNEGLELWVH